MTDLFPAADVVILDIEGVRADDPRDPGGLTLWGVARNEHPEISDVEWSAFTFADAQALRRASYWDACRCVAMPWPLALAIYEDAINSGVTAAVRRLQRALGVVVDGKIGPHTLAAIPDPESDALGRLFFKFMYSSAAAYATDRNAAIYLNGWLNRLVIVTEAALLAPEEVGTV